MSGIGKSSNLSILYENPEPAIAWLRVLFFFWRELTKKSGKKSFPLEEETRHHNQARNDQRGWPDVIGSTGGGLGCQQGAH